MPRASIRGHRPAVKVTSAEDRICENCEFYRGQDIDYIGAFCLHPDNYIVNGEGYVVAMRVRWNYRCRKWKLKAPDEE